MLKLIFRCLFFVSVFGMSGCSFNEYGVVESERAVGDGAIIYTLGATGIHLDTRGSGISLSIGQYKAVHVFASACVEKSGIGSDDSEELFRSVRPELSLWRVVGLQWRLGDDEVGLTLGLREHAELLKLDKDASAMRKLIFDAIVPTYSYLRVSEENCSVPGGR